MDENNTNFLSDNENQNRQNFTPKGAESDRPNETDMSENAETNNCKNLENEFWSDIPSVDDEVKENEVHNNAEFITNPNNSESYQSGNSQPENNQPENNQPGYNQLENSSVKNNTSENNQSNMCQAEVFVTGDNKQDICNQQSTGQNFGGSQNNAQFNWQSQQMYGYQKQQINNGYQAAKPSYGSYQANTGVNFTNNYSGYNSQNVSGQTPNPNFYNQQQYRQPVQERPVSVNNVQQPYSMYQNLQNVQNNIKNQNPYMHSQQYTVQNMQYAQGNFNPQAPIPKKEKTKTCVWVLMLIISIVLSIFVGIFITTCVYEVRNNADNYDKSDSSGLFGGFNEKRDDDKDNTDKNDKSGNKDNTNIITDNFSLELKEEPKDAGSGNYTTQTAYDAVSPSVVGIVVYGSEITENEEDVLSQGTGIIISSDGYIVTNSHVVLNSNQYAVQVVTSENKKYSAKVVGYDSRTDIAVIKIDEKGLPVASFGDSSKVKVGQDIIAIGNPGGLNFQNSLTKGIVSAVDREFSTNTQVKYIQIDAAINPGNSGGPLCNLYGQVVGINTAKIASTEYEGMGFAIPSAKVKEIVDELIKNGYVSGRVMIGISGYEISSSEVYQYNVPQGIIIKTIVEGGPMDNEKVKVNDIITEIDGTDVKTFQDVYTVLGKHKKGDKVKVKLYRVSKTGSSGDYYNVEITLEEDKGATQ